MRDRLSHLHALSQSNGHVEELESTAAYLPSHNTRGEAPQQDNNDSEIEAVFDEAHGIRRDVQLIILDVK